MSKATNPFDAKVDAYAIEEKKLREDDERTQIDRMPQLRRLTSVFYNLTHEILGQASDSLRRHNLKLFKLQNGQLDPFVGFSVGSFNPSETRKTRYYSIGFDLDGCPIAWRLASASQDAGKDDMKGTIGLSGDLQGEHVERLLMIAIDDWYGQQFAPQN